jgi:zinc protease
MIPMPAFPPARVAVLLGGLLLAGCSGPEYVQMTGPGTFIDLTAPPEPLAERTVAFPAFEEFTLPNGLDVLVVPHQGQPVVNLNLYVRGGTAADPAVQAGRAGLAAELLTKGTASRSAEEIAETIEGVGGQLNAGAGGDWLSVSATVLAEHAPLAFDLLQDVALNPTFPQNELETTRRRTLSGLQAQLGQSGVIAQRQFARVVYGEHPYGIAAVPGTVEGITREDLVAFHRDHFAPGNALLVVSGAIDRAEAEALARRHFSDWRGDASAARSFPEVSRRQETRVYLVHRPGSVQSNIWVGHEGVAPDHPDYFPLQVLNRVLGGGGDARLFRILREEKGWTYGAYSRFTRPVDIGTFSASAEVRTEVTDSAVVEIMHQLRRLQDEAIPDEEFEAAVNFLAGSFPLRIETPGQIASQVAQARLLGLDPEDVTEYRQRIRAVTQADVRRVAREHVRPGAAAIVVVGDATQILERLEAVAPVSLYDVTGAPIDRSALVVRGSDETFDAARLEAQTATYQFLVQGNPMGTVRNELRREGGDWVATSTLESPVLGQNTEMQFSATDFAPRSVSQQVRQGPMTIRTDLRAEGGRIVGRAELPEQMGGARDVDVEMVQGTLLPGMEVYLLAAADLQEGSSLTVPVFNTMTNAISPTTFEVRGVEEVTVPAGTFQAFRIQATGATPLTMYVRQEAPHVMLRQEFAGQPVVIELQSLE